jgi:glycosyltransferase involved in cell wall biosynthesis
MAHADLECYAGATPASSRERLDAVLAGPHRRSAACCFSVVVPVYNEERTLQQLLGRLRAVDLPMEIVVVDDGSTDGTPAILDTLEGQPGIRIVRHSLNQGKGAALRTGFLRSTGDIVIVQDADLEYDPADYLALVAPIVDGEADVVFGSRFLRDGGPGAMRLGNLLGNRLLTRLSNLFTGLRLTDMETGYKLFRREVIAAIAPTLKQHRFGIEPELTAKIARHGCRICEVPIRYVLRGRAEGKKIRWYDAFKAMWCILRYWRWD